ncbi:AMP-binding protein [Variovorax sp. M-6]|uniref:AMP-binding protein n=1 Tax=Variovorax sp. M-6 TaxID=3233041 RepID=UPI003F9770A4
MTPLLTFSELLASHVATRPNAIAFIEDGREIRFSDFDGLCRQTASWLSAQGIGKGDRIAVWLVNRVEWLALVFAAARVGASLVAVNTRYRASELEHILQKSGARMLVLELGFRKIDFPEVLRDVNPDAVRSLQRVAVLGDASELPPLILGKPTVAFDPARHTGAAPPAPLDPDALAMLFTTSGTTSGPKLVMHTQRTILLHSRRAAGAYGFEEQGARLLGALPFCGVFGFNAAMAAFAAGAPTCFMDTFDAPLAVELIRRHGLTHVFGSDEMYARLFDHVSDHRSLPSIRTLGFSSFSYSAEEFALPARERGFPLTGLYGSSEVQALFAMQPTTLPPEQLIQGGGRPASGEWAQIRIRDVDTSELLAPQASGEIEIRADTSFVGYFNDDEATRSAVDADGFFRTGDIGCLRTDGTFVYQTRRGDAIRLAGFLVSPTEIETTLAACPGVAEAQVVAARIDGQIRCVAFVLAQTGAAVTEADVIAHAAGCMAAFKVPARVWVIDEFPTTQGANGTKIQRAVLRAMAEERFAETARLG